MPSWKIRDRLQDILEKNLRLYDRKLDSLITRHDELASTYERDYGVESQLDRIAEEIDELEAKIKNFQNVVE